jgi:hypothetical protein
MRIRSNLLVLGAISTLAWTCSIAHAVEVKSPDGRVVLSLEVKHFEGVASYPVYSVTYRGKVVVAPSRLGLVLTTSPGGSVTAEGLRQAALGRATQSRGRGSLFLSVAKRLSAARQSIHHRCWPCEMLDQFVVGATPAGTAFFSNTSSWKNT